MNRKEKRIYKRITRMFDNKEPDKAGVKRLDLKDKLLCLEPNGKLYTEEFRKIKGYTTTEIERTETYFLNKNAIYCLLPELEKLLNEVQKN